MMASKKPDKAGKSKKIKAKDLDEAALDKVHGGFQASQINKDDATTTSSGSFIASGVKKKS
jgi:hypothetical protein